MAELGLTLDFDIFAELARIEAKKLRRSAHNTARLALRQKVYYVEFLDDDGFSELKRQCELTMATRRRDRDAQRSHIYSRRQILRGCTCVPSPMDNFGVGVGGGHGVEGQQG